MLKTLRRVTDAKNVLLYTAVCVAMIFLNNAVFPFCPLASSLLFPMLLVGCNPFICFLIYEVSFLPFLSAEKIFTGICSGGLLCLIYGVLGNKKTFKNFSVILLAASLTPYVITASEQIRTERLIATTVICACALSFIPAVRAIKTKRFAAPTAIEGLSASFLYCAVCYGGIKYFGTDAYKAFAVLICFFLCTLNKGNESCLFWAIAAIPHVLVTKTPNLLLPYLLFGFSSHVFAGKNSLLLSLCCLTVECASAYIFKIYGDYTYVNAVYVFAAILLGVLLPEKLYVHLRKILSVQNEKFLSRYEINKVKSFLGMRLYETSASYRELSELFKLINTQQNPFTYREKILTEIKDVCKNCSFYSKCKANDFPETAQLTRLISIAESKGRLSAVDLPKQFSACCNQTSAIIFAVNKFAAKYTFETEKAKAAADVRKIAEIQAYGLSLALRGLASKASAKLQDTSKAERALKRNLLSNGVSVSELMIFGEGENTEIHLFLLNDYNEKSALSRVNNYFKKDFQIKNRYKTDDRHTLLTLEPSCGYDCVFGISTTKKNGEETSGDTHSLTRISRNSFLLALSDGMGSGEKAQKLSSVSLSLIECLYRAGIPPEVCLETVNGLLSFPGEDCFAALDVGVINLSSLTCDFIKLGAPYGFILSKGVVKLIEGSSLPLGIVKELKPSVCSEPLSQGDVLIFVSDGVTDAFGSSTNFADFLSSIDEVNPQKLSDSVLREAFTLYGNRADDDMTVIACKIFAS